MEGPEIPTPTSGFDGLDIVIYPSGQSHFIFILAEFEPLKEVRHIVRMRVKVFKPYNTILEVLIETAVGA
jgi:hypothetical protein